MVDKELSFEIPTLIIIVLFLDFLERHRPGHAVDRRQAISLNILALGVVIVAGEMWKEVLITCFNLLDLANLFSPLGTHGLQSAFKIISARVLADFCLYWVHRGMHRTGTMWRTHMFHHSIEHLWWLSGSRTSVTHLFLFAFPQVIIAYYLFGMSAWEAGIAFSFGVVVNIWIHTNLWVSSSPLEWLFITPNYHRVHHGSRGLLQKNLGFVFTVWDRVFGTYADPRSMQKDFALGFVPTQNRLLRMIIGF